MNLEYVKKTLKQGEYTCVLFHNEELVMSSYEKGIIPLYSYVCNVKELLTPVILGDKIIGRAAAFLAIYANVKQLYTEVISEGAIEILEQYGVKYTYDYIVPYIENRTKTGQCPMEESIKNVNDAYEAFIILKNFIENRNKKV